jgi:hypothetical protein
MPQQTATTPFSQRAALSGKTGSRCRRLNRRQPPLPSQKLDEIFVLTELTEKLGWVGGTLASLFATKE